MRRALSEYVVCGIRTNIPFHIALLHDEAFVAGTYDTGFIGRNEAALLTSGSPGDAREAMVLGAAIARAFRDDDDARRGATTPAPNGGARMSPWRLAAFAKM